MIIFRTQITSPSNNFYITLESIKKDLIGIKSFTAKDSYKLKNDLTFRLNQLHNHIYVDNTLIDNLDFKARFSLVYVLLQQKNNRRKVLTFGLKSKFNPIAQTVSNIFYGIGAAEREIYDLFGISFKDHPDLRRVVTDYGFRGNPLKKDFPLTGTMEIVFSIIKKILIFRQINLSQEMRTFDYESPWITNNDFFNYPKTEQEDDLEMGIIVKIFLFALLQHLLGLDWTTKTYKTNFKSSQVLEYKQMPKYPVIPDNKQILLKKTPTQSAIESFMEKPEKSLDELLLWSKDLCNRTDFSAWQLIAAKRKLQNLRIQKDLEIAQVTAQKDTIIAQKDVQLVQKDGLITQKDALIAQQNIQSGQKDDLIATMMQNQNNSANIVEVEKNREITRITMEKDTLLIQKDTQLQQKDDLINTMTKNENNFANAVEAARLQKEAEIMKINTEKNDIIDTVTSQKAHLGNILKNTTENLEKVSSDIIYITHKGQFWEKLHQLKNAVTIPKGFRLNDEKFDLFHQHYFPKISELMEKTPDKYEMLNKLSLMTAEHSPENKAGFIRYLLRLKLALVKSEQEPMVIKMIQDVQEINNPFQPGDFLYSFDLLKKTQQMIKESLKENNVDLINCLILNINQEEIVSYGTGVFSLLIIFLAVTIVLFITLTILSILFKILNITLIKRIKKKEKKKKRRDS